MKGKQWMIPAAVVVGLASTATLSFAWHKNDKKEFEVAKARLQSIWLKNPKKTKFVYFRTMAFRIGPSFQGEGMYQMLPANYDSLSDQQFQTLRTRVKWLSGGIENYVGAAAVHLGKFKTPQSLQFYGIFGVEANEMVGPDGKKKLYAVKAIQTLTSRVYPSSTHFPPPPLDAKEPKREDFANPADIDWMFGVKDFTKVRSN